MIQRNTDFPREFLVNCGGASFLYCYCSAEGFLLCVGFHATSFLAEQEENHLIFGVALEFTGFNIFTKFIDFSVKHN